LDSDLARLTAIARLLDEQLPDKKYFCTLDGNEQYTAMEELQPLVEALQSRPELRRLAASLLSSNNLWHDSGHWRKNAVAVWPNFQSSFRSSSMNRTTRWMLFRTLCNWATAAPVIRTARTPLKAC
jgi:hypothetical protein